jgi:hypothetical protein
VRVRRASDNAEEDFTASEVSSGALVAFGNPTYTVGTSVESASRPFDSFTSNGNDGFTATNNTTGSATAGFPYTFATGDVISVSFDLVIANNATPTFILSASNLGSGSLAVGTTFTSSGSYTQEVTSGSGTGTHLAFTDGNTGTFTISNFKVTSHKADGFVETWYDQSGNSNDAVQETAGSQPKIVNSGSLVVLSGVPALSFDDSFFVATGFAFSPSGDFLAVTVSKISTGNLLDTRDGGNDGLFIQQGGSDVRYRYNGDGSIDVSGNNQHIISTVELNGTTLTAYKDGSSAGTDTVTAGLSTTEALSIGKVAFSSANTVSGSVQEVILYATDKSANRVALETNINSHYSIF